MDLLSSVLIIVLLLHHLHVNSLFGCILDLLHIPKSFFLTGNLRVLLLNKLIHCFLDPLVKDSLSLSAYFISGVILCLWLFPFKCHLGVNPWGSRPRSHSISLIILNSLKSSL